MVRASQGISRVMVEVWSFAPASVPSFVKNAAMVGNYFVIGTRPCGGSIVYEALLAADAMVYHLVSRQCTTEYHDQYPTVVLITIVVEGP